jgi:hypothetical protein
MGWFRTQIRHGSRLALLALALQFVLAFGHFHGVAAPAQLSFVAASANGPAQPLESDAADGCAICAVVAMASTALVAAPPMLALPVRTALPAPLPAAVFVTCDAPWSAFNARAPPLS